ncbi:SEC-C metal-binding domain-containing protein [Bacillus sp. 3255]|uniref:SEC-C metal-binding domain-containing protein n=1 Tax=Bacillus sp. 3255 TaxID=2817904 RepID=UPI0028595DFB|nr:SEC-C metal-binding domain-containing protein [Bacillus sp. 3255]MDR6883096.1 hypothetical protein [Bacillus sp. 3255]
MKHSDIHLYLKKKIPQQGHSLSHCVHEFSMPEYGILVHPVVNMLVEVLVEIEKSSIGFAVKMINRISETSQIHQIYSNFAEILVIQEALTFADKEDGIKYLLSEPQVSLNSKNPEFRSKANNIYYAVEVKSPDLDQYAVTRQSGIQVTSHLHNRNLADEDKVSDPRILTVKEFLTSAEDKFKQYVTKKEYKDDVRLVAIVWDDYVNEVLPALISPQCGMFTENSFWKKSKFELIDGVLIYRHRHQFVRSLFSDSFINGVKHAFKAKSDTPVSFVQNPNGRQVPKPIIDGFNAMPTDSSLYLTAEYRATDWVDWRTGVAIAGLDAVPLEYHSRVFEILKRTTRRKTPLVLPDMANFGTINLDLLIEQNTIDGEIYIKGFFKDLKRTAKVSTEIQRASARSLKKMIKEDEEMKRRALAERFTKYSLQNNANKHSNLTTSNNKNNKETTLGRNDPCSCGSGKKYKKCCMN